MMSSSSDTRGTVNRADRKRNALRAGLAGTAPVVAVGAHDAMSARLMTSRSSSLGATS